MMMMMMKERQKYLKLDFVVYCIIDNDVSNNNFQTYKILIKLTLTLSGNTWTLFDMVDLL